MGIRELEDCVQEVINEAEKLGLPHVLDLMSAIGGLQEEMLYLDKEQERAELATRQTAAWGGRVELGQAVLAFAKWQETGYSNGMKPDTLELVSRQLWWGVAQHVRGITGEESPYPCASIERDAARCD
jgi:hypothetical protein